MTGIIIRREGRTVEVGVDSATHQVWDNFVVENEKGITVGHIPAFIFHLGVSSMACLFDKYMRQMHYMCEDELVQSIYNALHHALREHWEVFGDPKLNNSAGDDSLNFGVTAVTPQSTYVFLYDDQGEKPGWECFIANTAVVVQPGLRGHCKVHSDNFEPGDKGLLIALTAMQLENREVIGGSIVAHSISPQGIYSRRIGFLRPADENGHEIEYRNNANEVVSRVPETGLARASASAGANGHQGWQPAQPPQPRAQRQAPAAGAKVGRNAPCPCGSGRKAKRCCQA